MELFIKKDEFLSAPFVAQENLSNISPTAVARLLIVAYKLLFYSAYPHYHSDVCRRLVIGSYIELAATQLMII